MRALIVNFVAFCLLISTGVHAADDKGEPNVARFNSAKNNTEADRKNAELKNRVRKSAAGVHEEKKKLFDHPSTFDWKKKRAMKLGSYALMKRFFSKRFDDPPGSYDWKKKRFDDPPGSYDWKKKRFDDPPGSYDWKKKRFDDPPGSYDWKKKRFDDPPGSYDWKKKRFDNQSGDNGWSKRNYN